MIRFYFLFSAGEKGGRDGTGWDLHSLFFLSFVCIEKDISIHTQLNSTNICPPPFLQGLADEEEACRFRVNGMLTIIEYSTSSNPHLYR